jgi:hypothetical protein
MAVTHTWSVKGNLKVENTDSHQNVVFKTYWRVSSLETVDGVDYGATSTGSVNLNTDNLDPFTPFEDLTEEQVLGWTKSKIDADAISGDSNSCAEWEAVNVSKIENQKNYQPEDKTAPWVTS